MITAEKAKDKMETYKEARNKQLYKDILKEAEAAINFGAESEEGWAEVFIHDLNEKYTERLAQDFAYNGYDVFMRLALNKRYMVFRWCKSAADLPAGVALRKKSLERMRDEFEEMEREWQNELELYSVYCLRKNRENSN